MKNILLLTLMLVLFVPTTFYGQSKQTQKAKVDSSLVCIDATIKAIEKCCISILTSPPYKYIVISSKYPMNISFNKLTDQSSFSNVDYVSLGSFDNIKVDVYKKTSLIAIGNVTYGMDFSSGSFNGGGYIESGEHEFRGGLIASGKIISFENAKFRFEDDKGMCKINDGAKCVIDGKEYFYKNGKWGL
jgi:hypothetical protein